MNCTGLEKQGNLKLLTWWSLIQNKASKLGTFFGTPCSVWNFRKNQRFVNITCRWNIFMKSTRLILCQQDSYQTGHFIQVKLIPSAYLNYHSVLEYYL